MSNKKARKRVKPEYTAVIVGAGRIAAQFDDPKSKVILTQAHAFTTNTRIDFRGFYDVSQTAANQAAKKWQTKSYNSLAEMFREARPDIVSICTPDEMHFKLLRQIADYKPRLVICEKPLTTKAENSRKIIQLYQKNKVPLQVNYSRRYDPTVQGLQKQLAANRFGRIICASGIYTKGLLHNGSHLIDLARFLLGEVTEAKQLFRKVDFSPADPSVAAWLRFTKCEQFYLKIGGARKYSIFELDILCEKKRLRFHNSGLLLTTQEIINNPSFKGYRQLGEPTTISTKLIDAMPQLITNAVNYLDHREPLLCDGREALATQIACERILHN